jgi:hypothetical protein
MSEASPFSVSDICALFPLVKHTIRASRDATELLEMGKALLAIGRLARAFEVLQAQPHAQAVSRGFAIAARARESAGR